jgi:hypothetical protein
MATLSGNKIKDTYQSLIKFNDNGTADGSLQLLSDGAGNSIGISVDNSGNISSSAVGTLVGTTSSNVVNATMLDVSGNGTSGQSLLSDGDGSFSWGSPSVTIADGSITTAKLANDAVDGTKIADDSVNSEHYVDGSIDTVHIADDNITFDKIENRYTARSTTSSTSGTISIDWSAATTFYFSASLTGATTISFTNFKQGQVIGIYGLTGSQTITLDSDAATSETFNRIGTSEYDGTGTNFLQVACVDDSATAVFNYSVITYTADTTP